MISSFKRHSISRDYLIIFAVMMLTISSLACAYIWSVYQSREEIRAQALSRESHRINREITLSFDYVTTLMKFLGEAITKDNNRKLTKIAELLRSNLIKDESIKERFSWVMFDWDNPQNKMVVSTVFGVLKEPKDVSHRYYAQMAAKEPWKLNFDSADIGISSGEWIIPAGMGITDKKETFIGMLSMGFNVAKFSQKIEKAMDSKDVSFLVLDKHHKVALHSSDNESTKLQGNIFKTQLENIMRASGSGALPDPIRSGDIVYSYYYKMDGYPYTILVGYNKAIATQDFRETLLPGLAALTIIGAIAIMLLFLFRHLLVKPVIRLSEAADNIAAGTPINHIEGCNTYETANLAEQLLKVNALIKANNEANENLEELLRIGKESDQEKETFLKDMYKALQTPLITIKEGALEAQDKGIENLSHHQHKEYFEMMHEAANQLLTYTTNILTPSETDVSDLVKKCIIIHKKTAVDCKLTLTVDIEEDIPFISADKLRLRQILLSTIHESISFTPPNGMVHVHAHTEKTSDGKPIYLILTVKDNGMGLDEAGRRDFNETTLRHRPELEHDANASSLSLKVIRQLIKLHHGTFEINAEHGRGTTFTIRLPYYCQEHFMQPSDLSELDMGNGKTVSNNDNIIFFPKKRL